MSVKKSRKNKNKNDGVDETIINDEEKEDENFEKLFENEKDKLSYKCFSFAENNYLYHSRTMFEKLPLDEIYKYSPKLKTLLDNIDSLDELDFKIYGKKFKHYIYSNRDYDNHGYTLIEQALKKKGLTSYNPSVDQKNMDSKSFLKIFNDKKNVHGDSFRFIILSSHFKEGIDLNDVKYCHIFEEPDNKSDLEQIIGRGKRFCGQRNLPFIINKGWTLKVFIYRLMIPFSIRRKNYHENNILSFSANDNGKQMKEDLYTVVVKGNLDSVANLPNNSFINDAYVVNKKVYAYYINFQSSFPTWKHIGNIEGSPVYNIPYGTTLSNVMAGYVNFNYDYLYQLYSKYKRNNIDDIQFITDFAWAMSVDGVLTKDYMSVKNTSSKNFNNIFRQSSYLIDEIEDLKYRPYMTKDEENQQLKLRYEEFGNLIKKENEKYKKQKEELENSNKTNYEMIEKYQRQLSELEDFMYRLSPGNQRTKLNDEKKQIEIRIKKLLAEIEKNEKSLDVENKRHNGVISLITNGFLKMKEYVLRFLKDGGGSRFYEILNGIPNDKHEQLWNEILKRYGKYKWAKPLIKDDCTFPVEPNIAKLNLTQKFLMHYFTPQNKLKGMLLWHSTGSGKTCTSVAIASGEFEKKNYRIILVTRPSLKQNFYKNMFDTVCHMKIQDLSKVEDAKRKDKNKNDGGDMYKVLPKDNLEDAKPEKINNQKELLNRELWEDTISHAQFSNFCKGKGNKEISKDKRNNVPNNGDPLWKTLVIIDEAHYLFKEEPKKKSVSNTASSKVDYEAIKKAIRNSYEKSGENSVKVLLLTATPMTKSAFEFIQLINLLKEEDIPISNGNELKQIISYENPNPFNNLINDYLSGHISYLDRTNDPSQFAQYETEYIYAPMTQKQEEYMLTNKNCLNLSKKDVKKYKIDNTIEMDRFDDDIGYVEDVVTNDELLDFLDVVIKYKKSKNTEKDKKEFKLEIENLFGENYEGLGNQILKQFLRKDGSKTKKSKRGRISPKKNKKLDKIDKRK